MHRQGAIAEAASRYGQVLAAEPRNVDALYLLGVTLVQQGRLNDAVSRLRKAVKVAPTHALAHNFLGLAYLQQAKTDEALRAFDRAIQYQPKMLDAYVHRANLLMKSGRAQDAVATYDRALAAEPQFHEGWSNRGIALDALGRRDEAIASYDRAIALKPEFAEAHANRANAFAAAGRHDEAIAGFDRALAARPGFAEAWVNRGNALKALNRPADALDSYDRALAVNANLAEAHYSRALMLGLFDRHGEALASVDRAIELNLFHDRLAERARLRADRASLLNLLGRFDEAFAEAARALAQAPDDDRVVYTVSFMELMHGRWREGWVKHERRIPLNIGPEFRAPRQPMWQGEELGDNLLLICNEQGRGDRIQFARFAAHLAQQGKRVAFYDELKLGPLLMTVKGIERVVSDLSEIDDIDQLRWVRMLSVPSILETTPDNIPGTVPYLAAEPERIEAWKARLPGAAFRIGIGWQGNPEYPQDKRRSVPLAQFAPLAAVPGVRLISLQKGFGSEQVDQVAFRDKIDVLGDDFDAGPGAFLDTAAVMTQLDLVVSIDSALAHMAGALGRPLFVALPPIGNWRWLLDREDSPWYPSARLFRQTATGDWTSVFARMATAIGELAAQRMRQS